MAKRPHARSLLIALCAALCAAGAAIAQPQYPSPTLGEATRVMRTPTGAPAPVDMIAKVMRRVDLDDYRLPGEGDYCAALQRAHDAIPGGAIHLPVGVVQLGTSSQACQIEWTRPIRLVGQGWSETHVSGSVIYIPAPPVGWNGAATFHVTSTAARGSVFSGFSIRQDQPPPAAGWTPTVYPPVWSLSNTAGGVIITDLLAAPVYDLVRADLSGRLEVSHIRGQVLHSVVAVDRSYDSDRYDAWHIWPYWSSHASVRDWQQSNLVAMTLGRVDTPFVDRIFMIWGRTLLAASGSANGVPSKIKAGALACDGCYKAVTVSANNVTGSIASLMWQGEDATSAPGVGTPRPGGRALDVSGVAARLSLGALIAERGDGPAIEATGAANIIDVTTVTANLINQSGGAHLVGALGAGSVVNVAVAPSIEGSGGAGCGQCVVGAQLNTAPGAVNSPRLFAAVPGAPAAINAIGPDTDIGLSITPKGAGRVALGGAAPVVSGLPAGCVMVGGGASPITCLAPGAAPGGAAQLSTASYGAKGDGVTGDAAALRAAFVAACAASASQGGASLYIPPGVYRWDLSGDVPLTGCSGVTIWSHPGAVTLKRVAGTSGTMIHLVDSTRMRIVGVGFDSARNLGGGTGASMGAVVITGGSHIDVAQATLENDFALAVEYGAAWVRIADNALIKTGISVGGYLTRPSTDNTAGMAPAQYVTITGNRIVNAEQEAVDVNWAARDITIANNVMIDNYTYSGSPTSEVIDIGGDAESDIVVTGNIVDNSGSTGVATYAQAGVRVKLGATRVQVMGNTIRGLNASASAGAGVQVEAATPGVIVSGNTVAGGWRCVNALSDDVVVAGNRCSAPAQVGIYAQSLRVAITGNMIDGGGVATGIQLAGVKYATVTGNTIQSAQDAIVGDGGASYNAISGNASRSTRSLVNIAGVGNTISGNSAYAAGVYGINIAGAQSTVTANTISASNAGIVVAAADATLTGNTITNSSGAGSGYAGWGITLQAGSDGAIVTNNRVSDTRSTGRTQYGGLNISAAIAACVVKNNIMRNTTTTNAQGWGNMAASCLGGAADNVVN